MLLKIIFMYNILFLIIFHIYIQLFVKTIPKNQVKTTQIYYLKTPFFILKTKKKPFSGFHTCFPSSSFFLFLFLFNLIWRRELFWVFLLSQSHCFRNIARALTRTSSRRHRPIHSSLFRSFQMDIQLQGAFVNKAK